MHAHVVLLVGGVEVEREAAAALGGDAQADLHAVEVLLTPAVCDLRTDGCCRGWGKDAGQLGRSRVLGVRVACGVGVSEGKGTRTQM